MEKKQLLHEVVFSALEAYNKTRSPEATARLVSISEEEGIVVIEFEGSFCLTCGVRDWVEDYAYVLRSMGCEARLIEYRKLGDNEFKRLGVFKLDLCKQGD